MAARGKKRAEELLKAWKRGVFEKASDAALELAGALAATPKSEAALRRRLQAALREAEAMVDGPPAPPEPPRLRAAAGAPVLNDPELAAWAKKLGKTLAGLRRALEASGEKPRPGAPAKESDLARLEASWGVKLPADYRAFMLLHDGYHLAAYECSFPSTRDLLEGSVAAAARAATQVASEHSHDLFLPVCKLATSGKWVFFRTFDPKVKWPAGFKHRPPRYEERLPFSSGSDYSDLDQFLAAHRPPSK